jgi:hypothetical protein
LLDLSDFNFETKEGQTALHQLYCSITEQRRIPTTLSLPPAVASADVHIAAKMLTAVGLPLSTGNIVKRFFNRILGLEIQWQNMLFQLFYALFDKTILDAKNAGAYDEGIIDLKAASVKIEKHEVVYTDKGTGAVTTHYVVKVDRGLDWESALKLCKQTEAECELNGFHQQNHSKAIVLVSV